MDPTRPPSDHGPLRRGRSPRPLLLLLALALGLAGVEFYALTRSGGVGPPMPAAVTAPASGTSAMSGAPGTPASGTATLPASPAGFVDAPANDAIVGPRVQLSGWALSPASIQAVEVRVGERRYPARTGLSRPDVGREKPGYPEGDLGGFAFDHDFAADPPPPGWDRRTLQVVAVGRDGRETMLGSRTLIEPAAFTRWRGIVAPGVPPFFLLPALSGVAIGDASELDTVYRPYLSSTTGAGMRVPVLYLRTTRGEREDFAFDPGWNIDRRCGERRIADDALDAVLAHAKAKALPVLLTLNGGIWADASCDVPAWDVNDRLEQDPANCQWNQDNAVMPDDELKRLPGSQASPELARALTLNVYATAVRHYKKRNLQQAARLVVAFAREHPALFVGVTVDPDVYLNPFFHEAQWYDYNPGTLKQFREWLRGNGPYAGHAGGGVPDLSRYRRAKPLTLAEVNRISGRDFKRWEDVDPPRAFPRTGERPFWRDPWVAVWEQFRRHLVQVHYEELAEWLVEAGVPRDRIWTAQGFMAPTGDAMPFALRIGSPVGNFDSGGASAEGARPRSGHLGAILYGDAATNTARIEGPGTLFGAFAALDTNWAAVEYSVADLRRPTEMFGEAAAYRGLRELWNHDARFVSPMAWNGSNGVFEGKPGFVPYTAYRNTPLEEAAKDFLLARAGLPRGARLWTFGTPRHADDDGWTAVAGSLTAQRSSLAIAADAHGRVVLESPPEVRLDLSRGGKLAVLFAGPTDARVTVLGRAAPGQPWVRLGEGPASQAGGVPVRGTTVDQLRLEIALASPQATITRIAAMPAFAPRR